MIELTPDEHKILVDAIQDSATVVHKGRKDMNERIRQLAEQAREETQSLMIMEYKNFESKLYEKFAELIVKECADKCLEMAYVNPGPHHYAAMLKEHFGVEE